LATYPDPLSVVTCLTRHAALTEPGAAPE
jgi:hypothetical protein